MSSRNIAVRKDVYDALRKEKRGGESFTQLFLRLLRQRGPLDELAGVWVGGAPGAETRRIREFRGFRASGGRR